MCFIFLGLNQKIVYSLETGSNRSVEHFEVEPEQGTVYLKQALDHEQANIHHFLVVATDQGVPNLSSSTFVLVKGNLRNLFEHFGEFECRCEWEPFAQVFKEFFLHFRNCFVQTEGRPERCSWWTFVLTFARWRPYIVAHRLRITNDKCQLALKKRLTALAGAANRSCIANGCPTKAEHRSEIHQHWRVA